METRTHLKSVIFTTDIFAVWNGHKSGKYALIFCNIETKTFFFSVSVPTVIQKFDYLFKTNSQFSNISDQFTTTMQFNSVLKYHY